VAPQERTGTEARPELLPMTQWAIRPGEAGRAHLDDHRYGKDLRDDDGSSRQSR
jgi:hypothetical protein